MRDLDILMEKMRAKLAQKRSREEWAALSARTHEGLANADKNLEILSGDPVKAQAFIDAKYKMLTGL